MKAAVLAVLISTLPLTAVAQQRSNIVFTGDFEKGTLEGWRTEGCCTHSNTVVNSPARNGNFSYRSLLKPTDEERAEIKQPAFPKNVDRWVGVSIYIPSGGSTQYACIFQFARKPGGGRSYDPSFQLLSENGRLRIKRYGTGTLGKSGANTTWDLGTIEYDKWIDFVYHYKGSSGSSGVFDVWMNGVEKVKYRGPTEHARNEGPFIKMGYYVGLNNRVSKDTQVYYDDFRIGNEKATYADVAPSTTLFQSF